MNLKLALLVSCALVAVGPRAARASALTATPSTITIGNVTVSDSATGTTTVSGTGTIASFDVSTGGPGGTACDTTFSITTSTSPPIMVTSTSSATITAKYAPIALGAESCTVTMRDNMNNALGTFAITGTGIAWASVSPASQDFGSVRWNNAAPIHSSTFPFTIANASPDHALTVMAIVTNGGNAADFTVVGAPSTIAAGGSAPFHVTFDPSAAGARATTLEVETDDPTTPTIDVALTGTGTNGVISVPATLDFSIVLDGTSSTQPIAVSNTAATPVGTLTVTSATIAQSSTWFSFATGNGCSAGATSCTFPPLAITSSSVNVGVTCAPPAGATGVQTATVTFASDTDDGTHDATTLSCTAGAPTISGPAQLPFGSVQVGSATTPTTLTVTNTGTTTLTISNAALTSGASDYVITSGPTSGFPITVAVNGTVSWSIECQPITFGSRPGTFTVTSNAVNQASLGVPLTCTGQEGVLAVSPTTYNFGGVRVTDIVSHTVTLQNNGNLPVSNITATLTNTTVGYSVTSPTFPITLAANGGSQSVTVQFAPQATTDGGAINLVFSGQWGTSSTTMAVLALNAQALAAGFSTNPASPTPLDFGTLRFDQTPTLTYSVIDTDSTPVTIESQSIAPASGTPTGAFTITGCTHGGTAVTCPSAGNGFQLTGTNDTLVVSVQCNPQGMVAMLSATITVTSDLAGNPNRSLQVQGNSTSAELAVTPSTNLLDFGNVDMQAGPITQTITLTNTGAATLNTAQATIGGANAARFQFSATTAQAIAPGASFAVQVTYTPTTEAAANQYDTASISFPLTGIYGGPSMLVVAIRGRGINRHIAAGNAPTFPDTFRNPGNQAPVLPFTVTNTGEAVLSISAVMLTDQPIWTLENPTPVDIPGGESYAFMIRFAPTASGRAPDGELSIMDNDTGRPMVSVALQGNGIDRDVQMTPPVIDLGYAGVGIPVKLSSVAPSELLAIASMDATHSFTIRAIDIDGGDGAFIIADAHGNAPQGIALAPNATQTFDITFTPPSAGDFTATATLFLDMDPTAQATVQLQGHGVDVQAQGGGGCSTGDATGTGVVALVPAALLALRRRTRVLWLEAAALIVCAPFAARADNRALDLSMFEPTPSTTGETFQVQSAAVGPANTYAITAVASYATDPLVLATAQNNDAAISTRTMLELGGAYALLGRLELGAYMPVYLQSGQTIDTSGEFGVAPATGTALGDVTLSARATIWRGAALGGDLATGLAGALSLPTATSGEFAGTSTAEGRVLALTSFTPAGLPRLAVAINVGAVLRERYQFANIDQGSGVVWGVGASYRVLDPMTVSAELFGEVVPSGIRDMATTGAPMGSAHALTTIEALAGVRYQLDRHFNLGAAVGRGVTSGIGSPDFRGVVLLALRPDTSAAWTAARAVDMERDSDGDGIPDYKDKCPNEPEDKDGFEDQDGCPDLDNDHDGIPDAQDKCPNDPEDKDGFQDADGCPDPDNDHDGIPDTQDKCPNDPEDKDGFQDADGCPDPDNDHDGIPDTQDKCPNDPETINGFQDDDGCPDKGDSQVIVGPDRLELLEVLRWNGPRLAKASANLLGQIGATLRAHIEIARVRITVHVQPSGDDDRDQDLSDKRAAAIRDWLVQWGVVASRLEARGFGGTKPLVPPDRAGAAQLNNRVELVIIERN